MSAESKAHTRLLTLATTGELESAKKTLGQEDVIPLAVLDAVKMSSEAVRTWIETVLAERSIGWGDIEAVKKYVADRFSSAGLRLIVQEKTDSLPETWRVESEQVGIVEKGDEEGEEAMEAIRSRTGEAMKESISKMKGEESAPTRIMKELAKRPHGAWAHEPEIKKIWEEYDPSGISQLVGQRNKGFLKSGRNLKIHVRGQIAIMGSGSRVYLPDPGVEILQPDTLEILEQVYLRSVDKRIRIFLRRLIDGKMDADFEEVRNEAGFTGEQMKIFLVDINKVRLRQYGVKITVDSGKISVQRLGGEVNGVVTEDWKAILLGICKNTRTGEHEKFLRIFVKENGSTTIERIIEETGMNRQEISGLIGQLNYKTLKQHGLMISADVRKQEIFISKIGAEKEEKKILIAEDLMIGETSQPSRQSTGDVANTRERLELPDSYSSETELIVRYLLAKVEKEKTKKILSLLLENPKGVDVEMAEKELDEKGDGLTARIKSLNYALLKNWGHGVVCVGKKVIIKKTTSDEVIANLTKEIERRQKRQEEAKVAAKAAVGARAKARATEAAAKAEAKAAEAKVRAEERNRARAAEAEARATEAAIRAGARAKARATEAKVKAEARAKARAEAEVARAEAKIARAEAGAAEAKARAEERNRARADAAEAKAKAAEAEADAAKARAKAIEAEARAEEDKAAASANQSANRKPQKLTIITGKNGGEHREETIGISQEAVEKIVGKANGILRRVDGDREIEVVGLDRPIQAKVSTIRGIQFALLQIAGGLEIEKGRISQESLRKLEWVVGEIKAVIEK